MDVPTQWMSTNNFLRDYKSVKILLKKIRCKQKIVFRWMFQHDGISTFSMFDRPIKCQKAFKKLEDHLDVYDFFFFFKWYLER